MEQFVTKQFRIKLIYFHFREPTFYELTIFDTQCFKNLPIMFNFINVFQNILRVRENRVHLPQVFNLCKRYLLTTE